MRYSVLLICLLGLLCLTASARGSSMPKSNGQLNLRFAKMVSIKVKDGPEARLIEAKPGKWEGNLIIFLHDNGGLNQVTATRVEELARRSGAVVICPDFYLQAVNSGQVLSDSLRMAEIVRSCVDYGGKSCRIQLMAWGDPGCSLVLKAAAVTPERFYGAVLVDGLPAADTALASELEGPLFLIRNKVSMSVKASVRDAFSLLMSRIGKVFRVFEFSGVNTAKSALAGNTELDEAGWLEALGFLKQNFQAPMRRNTSEKP